MQFFVYTVTNTMSTALHFNPTETFFTSKFISNQVVQWARTWMS